MVLDLEGDLVALLRTLVDLESVSGNEKAIADAVEEALRRYDHLEVERDADLVMARTNLGRDERIVIAGHLDTVPVAGNLPSWTTGEGDDLLIWGRGSCDMKGGVAVQLAAAARLAEPNRDITWIFYDNEEIAEEFNGLARVARSHPDWLSGSFAVLGEPSNAGIEGGCQGTLRVRITLTGRAAHSARAWMGDNAIHAAAPLLTRLLAYEPRQIVVDGLTYREGLNAVKIEGGIAGNVIPDRCVVELNYRFAPDKSVEQAVAYLRDDVLAGFELEVVDAAAGARPGLDQPAAAAFVAAVGAAPSAKFGWTDVARFAAMGVPAVNFGPGNPSKAHADDEFCPAAELTSCYEALVRWLS
ncbi:succinyl-diaminopimelate desuccinylase [Microlunatus ginsengisoli]